MSETTIEITRYPNRRFYDRSQGRYVTLPEIAESIRAGATVIVRDSRNGEDLTRPVLAQIILERFPERMSLFPATLLHWMLRANDLAADWLRSYLEQSLTLLQAGPTGAAGVPPRPAGDTKLERVALPSMGTPTGSAPEWLQTLWKPWLGSASPIPRSFSGASVPSPAPTTQEKPPTSPAPTKARPAVAPNPAATVEASLRDRLTELEERFRALEAGSKPRGPRPKSSAAKPTRSRRQAR